MLIQMEVYCFISFVVLGIGAQMLKYCPNINPIKSIRLEAYQMSTMKKRIPMFLLALAMMVAMALPSFADRNGPDHNDMTYRPFHAASMSNNYLNVTRTSTSVPAQGKYLTLWETNSPGTDQKFNETYREINYVSGFILQFAANPSLAVNRNSDNARAFLWTYADEASLQDSAFIRIDRQDQPKFKLAYGAKTYLTYAGDYNGARVTFGGNGYTAWEC